MNKMNKRELSFYFLGNAFSFSCSCLLLELIQREQLLFEQHFTKQAVSMNNPRTIFILYLGKHAWAEKGIKDIPVMWR